MCRTDLQFAVHAKAEVQTKLYIAVMFSSDRTMLVEFKNESTASNKHVSSVVQDPCFFSNSFSVRNLSILFVFKLDGLEVHLMLRFAETKHYSLLFFHTHCCTHNNRTYWYMATFLCNICILFVFYLWCQCNF